MGKRRFPRFIRVAAINFKPFFELPSNPNEKPGGIEGRLLETLSEALGFRYELVIAEDNEFGRLKSDGNWTGMIGLVTTGKADIATCSPAVTSDRMRAVDFSIPYITTDSAFSTNLPRHLPPAYTYWYPFDGYTWMCIFTLLMVMPLVFFAISDRRRSYFGALLTVFGSLIGKPTTNRNLKWRYMATGWSVCATFLSLSYGAVISSFLFKPLLDTQVKNMQELSKAVRAGDMKVYVWKGTFQVELMMESQVEHLMFLAEAIKKNKWFVDLKKGLSPDFYKGKVAFLEGRISLNLRYGLPPLRTKFISRDGCANTRAGIAIRKGFCCKDMLDRVLNRIMASGLHKKYLTDEIFKSWLTAAKQGSVANLNVRPLTLQDLSGAMYVLVAGNSAALVILLGEILFKFFFP